MAEKATLQKYGYNVIISNSGENAVKDIEDSPDIDHILMDINLGSGINGTEAASRILTDHDLPIIFLFSHAERGVVEKTEGITSYVYIVKNSGETVFIASIKMAFRLHDAKLNEKKKGEDLRESEQKSRCIFDAITDAFFLHPLFKIGFAAFVEVNSTACERYLRTCRQ